MAAGSHGIPGLELRAPVNDEQSRMVLTGEALSFLVDLHRRFDGRRLELLEARKTRQAALRGGARPSFLKETEEVRKGDWKVAPTPADLQDRRVEITGPADAKMTINALNSGARAFMADFEDSLSPTWTNLLDGQIALQRAVRRELSFTSPEGKRYALKDKLATLLVRPRGWHLPEKHVIVDGKPMSGSLFDFGLYVFHNAKETLARGSGPYFYLPKMESHREARLWNDVMCHAQERLGVPRGTIKCTVLIETILAAYEMDEILYELRDHIVGLNAGRWDYIFSIIKKFSHDPGCVLPDRGAVTMGVPFMRAYAELLVKTCHRRGAHAMGGMSAFVPSRKDEEVNRVAMAKVKEDKVREANAGFDGTWVAHPDLVPIATAEFDSILKDRPNQKDKQRDDVQIQGGELLDLAIAGAGITEAGVANNINVALQYIRYWLEGVGAVALHNLMEDAATAEIARAQLWQWIRHNAAMVGGRKVTRQLYEELRDRELERLGKAQHAKAAALLDKLVLSQDFLEFLTLPAYEQL
jgi:malate synthase